LLPSSLEEEYLVASVVALMSFLWLSWFFLQLELLVAIALSWLVGRHSQPSVATDALPVLLHPPLGGRGWMEPAALRSLPLHCIIIRE